MSGLPARTGWHWLKQGVALFRQQPTALTALLFFNLIMSGLVSRVPYLGQVVVAALLPSLSLAFMQACLLIEHQQRVPPSVLLTGMRMPLLLELVKVGMLYLLSALLLTWISSLLVSTDFMAQFKNMDPAHPPVIKLSDLLVVLLLSLLNLGSLVVSCYAAPLIYWQKMGVGKAIFYSFFGLLRSLKAFLVLLLIWFGMLLVVTLLLSLIVGNGTVGSVVLFWMVFVCALMLQCAVYCAFRQIFGVPDLITKPAD